MALPQLLLDDEGFMRQYRAIVLGTNDHERESIDRVIGCAYTIGVRVGLLDQLMRNRDDGGDDDLLTLLCTVATAVGHLSQIDPTLFKVRSHFVDRRH